MRKITIVHLVGLGNIRILIDYVHNSSETLLCLFIYKVDVPKANISIIWTPIFELNVVRFGYENGHQI